MKVQINTDKNIEGHERVEAYFSGELEKSLARFEDKITRIEVHFGDENSNKSGVDDKRCLITDVILYTLFTFLLPTPTLYP